MPSWEKIKQHLADHVTTYIVTLVVGFVLLCMGWIWGHAKDDLKAEVLRQLKESLVIDDPDQETNGKQRDPNYARAIRDFRSSVIKFAQQLIVADPDYTDSERKVRRDPASKDAIREFQQAAINKLTDLIELEPDYMDRDKKNKRNPYDAENVKAFQKALATNVNNINKVFIGYVHTGSLNLVASEETVDKPHSFDIFAAENSHVYLEFVFNNFDPHHYTIQLTFSNRTVCSDKKWRNGFNKVEFRVNKISTGAVHFLDGCKDEPQPEHQNLESAEESERLTLTQGHNDQIIQVGLKIISPNGKQPIRAEFDEAVKLKFDEMIRPPSPHAPPTQKNEDVTVDYIVVVSPLIKDAAFRKNLAETK